MSVNSNSTTEVKDSNPLGIPPLGDPPDLAQMEPVPVRSNPVATTTKAMSVNSKQMKSLEVNSTMVISNHKVEMVATPQLLYKIIQVVNHYVEHLIKHYESNNDDIHTKAPWYIRWKGIYPII